MVQAPDEAALVGTTLGGKYRILSRVGRGGMGSVYAAEHLVTKRVGALKLLHQRYAEHREVVTRFVREASAAARIGSPHIVQAFDAGALPDGAPYIFMELLQGAPLSALIEERRRLPFTEARAIVAQAALGLASAHEHGIVHRDIKPENLFLCAGTPLFVKILDFGICKLSEEAGPSRLTAEGAPLGTPHYMSREQVVGADVSFKTDIYSLGVVLYECLTGEVPFHAETLPALAVKIFEGQYARATELVPDLPEGVDALLATAMAHDPEQRFESMKHFHAALSTLSVAPCTSELADTQIDLEHAKVPSAYPAATGEPRVAPVQGARARGRGALLLFGVAGAVMFGLAVRSRVAPAPRLQSSADKRAVTRERPEAPREPQRVQRMSEPLPSALPSTSAVSKRRSPELDTKPRRPTNAPASQAERDGLARENPFQ